MRRYRAALLSVVVALSMVLWAVPTMAGTSTVSWDFSTGLALTPGSETEIAQLAVADPVGSACTADVETNNPDSVHPGNNLNVYLNGGLLISLQGFEDAAAQNTSGSAAFVATGSDQLVVYVESTGEDITSSIGSLTVTCEPPLPTEVTVSVSGECFYDGSAFYVYTVIADAGVTVDFDGLDLNLTDGETYTSNSGTASWEATAPDGSVFAGTNSGTATGVEEVEDCTPPGGGEGCTPGYWKQEHHFDSWAATGYAPYDSFDAVFGVDSSFETLLDGVTAKGGGENALARHAVAALLNSSNPDVSYEYSAAGVIALVQEAYDSGEFEAIKDMLEYQNEMGCPLN